MDENVCRIIVDRLPLFYLFLSGIGFSAQSLLVKLLKDLGVHALQCLLVRGIGQVLVASVIIYFDPNRSMGPALFGDTRYVSLILFLRALTGSIGVAATFLSAEMLPLGDSSVLVMLCSIIAPAIAVFVLGEPWRLPEFIATVISLIGAFLVAKPSFIFGDSFRSTHETQIGILSGVIAAFSYGFAYVFVRMLGTVAKMPWANVVLVQALGQVVLAVPAALVSGQSLSLLLTRREYVLIITLGAVGAFSQILMTIGMQREKSALATGMRMSDVVFGFIWQAAFTSDSVSVLSVIGAVLVTGSILMMVVTKESSATSEIKTGFEFGSNAPEFNVMDLTEDEEEEIVEDAYQQQQRIFYGPLSKGRSLIRKVYSIVTGKPIQNGSSGQSNHEYAMVPLSSGDEESKM